MQMELLSESSSKGDASLPVVLSPPLHMPSDANAESQTESQNGQVQVPEGEAAEDINCTDQVAAEEEPNAHHPLNSVTNVELMSLPPATNVNEGTLTELQNEQIQSPQNKAAENNSYATDEVELDTHDPASSAITSDELTNLPTVSEGNEETHTESQNEQVRGPQDQTEEEESIESMSNEVFQPPAQEMTCHDQTVTGDELSAKEPPPVTPPSPIEVIDLLDSDDDDASKAIQASSKPPAAKRQRMEGPPTATREASYQSYVAQMQGTATPCSPIISRPIVNQQNYRPTGQNQYVDNYNDPIYLDTVPGFVPCWKELMPAKPIPNAPQKMRSFQLSLLNVSEFTITGLRVGDEYNGYMTSLSGLRSHIKYISKGHGNAFYKRDEDGDGKWHIPLGAYQAFYGFLKSDRLCTVHGIPEEQLKIASLGKARLEKDHPSARKLTKLGVPAQLAKALAPFQRGGVDFVIEKEGRALIADEMGLGKSIQGIASMSVYHQEWPLLVLCPSSARYHWENEFRHWLGKNSAINQSEHAGAFLQEMENDESEEEPEENQETTLPSMSLLGESQIHVLTSSKDKIFPNESTRVVICSYGLAPLLVTSDSIRPGMFKCCIVDESHMLKNKASQRTKTLLPVLRATDRCILLSGTPAFARPMELWPQLTILGTEEDGWWQHEGDFIRKYVRSSRRRAELHTMLMGTVMIRRMKNDILKTLPAKVREQGIIDVMDESTRKEMQECMVTLRTGKGKLCELARGHADVEKQTEPSALPDESHAPYDQVSNDPPSGMAQSRSEMAAAQLAVATEQLHQEIHQRRIREQERIRLTLAATPYQLDPMMTHSFVQQMKNRLEHELHVYYQEQLLRITRETAAGAAAVVPASTLSPSNTTSQPEAPSAKKAVLNYMYSLTGNVKVPFVVEMLKRWLKDPTRGKLCLFAHHISVLNAIAKGAGLSNAADSSTKYIRIDGSTTPQARQGRINAFQGDPSIRVALLGITAAGVAVTLTAASNIWFAELFWTPAIMIQAEDRCHRIGQQAQVHCLYFVAKGTLDELLWKLLENKFENLGEFVEGKEKMKMVVNKTHHSKHELLKSIQTPDLTDFDEGDTFSDASLSDIEEISSDIEHEIEELGLSEQMMLDAGADNDDSDPDSQQNLETKPAAKDIVGRSENEAICLSDDEEVEEVSQAAPQLELPHPVAPAATDSQVAKSPTFVFNKSYPRMRVYKLRFSGASFGLIFNFVAGRLVVAGRSEARVQQLGLRAKPHVGDVLVAVNGMKIPIVASMQPAANMMMAAKQKGDVELWFAEDSEVTSHVIRLIMAERAAKAASVPPKQHLPVNVEMNDNSSYVRNDPSQMETAPTTGQAGPKTDLLIELIDDD